MGQRCRELFGDDNVFNIGFLSAGGTGEFVCNATYSTQFKGLSMKVTAAHEWDDPAQLMTMNHPIDGSLEKLLYDVCDGDALLITHRLSSSNGTREKSEEDRDLTE